MFVFFSAQCSSWCWLISPPVGMFLLSVSRGINNAVSSSWVYPFMGECLFGHSSGNPFQIRGKPVVVSMCAYIEHKTQNKEMGPDGGHGDNYISSQTKRKKERWALTTAAWCQLTNRPVASAEIALSVCPPWRRYQSQPQRRRFHLELLVCRLTLESLLLDAN